jgi:hypothetical protein
MMEYLTNASAERVLVIAAALMTATWIGGKLSGSTLSNSDYFWIAGMVISLAVVDHLHAIRKSLDRQGK